MARYKKYITTLSEHDQKACHMLSVVGKCEFKDLKSIEGMTKTRINNYIRDGYMLRDKDPDTGKTTYELTSDGRQFVKEKFGYTAYTARSWRHDSGLRDAYKKVPEQCRHTIKTEDQFKNELRSWIKEEKSSGDRDRWSRANDIEDRWNQGKLSCPDFTYQNESGGLVFVESITDYPKSVIDAKIEMAREFNADFQGIKR